MKILGLIIIVCALIVFGSVIAERFDGERQVVENVFAPQTGCQKLAEVECIAKNGCSPVYQKDTSYTLTPSIPTKDQGRGLNEVTIGGIFLACEADTTLSSS